MAIISVIQRWKDRSTSGAKGNPIHRIPYDLLVDAADPYSPAAYAVAVDPNTGLAFPQPDEPFSDNDGTVMMVPEVRQVAPGHIEQVAVYQKPPAGSDPEPGGGGNPFLKRAKITSVNGRPRQAKLDRFFDGKLILNSSDETPDPPYMGRLVDQVLQISFVIPWTAPSLLRGWYNAINGDFFQGYMPGVCIIDDIALTPQKYGAVPYWAAVATVAAGIVPPESPNPNGGTYGGQLKTWFIRLPDAGRTTKFGDNPPFYFYEPIPDSTGQPVSAPVLLNGKGEKLKPGDPIAWIEGQPPESEIRNFNSLMNF